MAIQHTIACPDAATNVIEFVLLREAKRLTIKDKVVSMNQRTSGAGSKCQRDVSALKSYNRGRFRA
ncbi:MAG: hypothetical protein AAGF25_15335, partial [Pseudomonadota bacterium]